MGNDHVFNLLIKQENFCKRLMDGQFNLLTMGYNKLVSYARITHEKKRSICMKMLYHTTMLKSEALNS